MSTAEGTVGVSVYDVIGLPWISGPRAFSTDPTRFGCGTDVRGSLVIVTSVVGVSSTFGDLCE